LTYRIGELTPFCSTVHVLKSCGFTDELDCLRAETGGLDNVIDRICRKIGIAHVKFFNWEKRDSGISPCGLGQLRTFDGENTKLKKPVPDLNLNKIMLEART